MYRSFERALSVTAVALAMAVSASRATRADVTAIYTDPQSYSYNVTHVPDFDQRRALLPNTGRQYCVPTACMNWMAYFANHGLPSLAPGPGNWQSASLYNAATSAIVQLGDLMGTDEDTGTGGDGAMAGLDAWLPDHKVAVSHYYTGSWWSPTIHDVSQHAFNGAYVVPVVGWYNTDDFPCITRGGGHALSLARAERDGGSMIIGWRDPASHEGLLFQQSPFATEAYAVEQHLVVPGGCTTDPRYMSKVVGYGSAYIDELFALYPLFALTAHLETLNITVFFSFRPFGSAVPQIRTFATARETNVVDIALHPDLGSYVYLAEPEDPRDPPQLWRLDPASGESTRIEVALAGPTRLHVGRRRGVYVLDGDDLVYLNIDPREPAEVARARLPGIPGALAYDDAADEVLVVGAEEHLVLRFPWHLDGEPDRKVVPADVPLEGRIAMAWDAAHEAIWLASEASDSVYQLTVDPETGGFLTMELRHERLSRPRAVDVDDWGRLYVSSEGKVVEFEMLAAGETWDLVADPLFPQLEAGDHLQISKSRSNFDEEIHTRPEWYHVPPEVFADPQFDCPPDLDESGDVDFNDLLLLLSAWGACSPDGFCHEDLDYTGDVGFSDLLVLLASWGPCP